MENLEKQITDHDYLELEKELQLQQERNADEQALEHTYLEWKKIYQRKDIIDAVGFFLIASGFLLTFFYIDIYLLAISVAGITLLVFSKSLSEWVTCKR